MSSDPYVEKVKDLFDSRSAVGLAKYGVDLTRTDVDFHGFLVHLQEELMDAALYIERLKDGKSNCTGCKFNQIGKTMFEQCNTCCRDYLDNYIQE